MLYIQSYIYIVCDARVFTEQKESEQRPKRQEKWTLSQLYSENYGNNQTM